MKNVFTTKKLLDNQYDPPIFVDKKAMEVKKNPAFH